MSSKQDLADNVEQLADAFDECSDELSSKQREIMIDCIRDMSTVFRLDVDINAGYD